MILAVDLEAFRSSLRSARRPQQSRRGGACASRIRSHYISGQCRQDLLQRAVQLARLAGAKVALDLASFEVVREFRADVEALIKSKQIECCFCNEVRLAMPAAHTCGKHAAAHSAALLHSVLVRMIRHVYVRAINGSEKSSSGVFLWVVMQHEVTTLTGGGAMGSRPDTRRQISA